MAETPLVSSPRESARKLWLKHYPGGQTALSFLLALLATASLSIDPARNSYGLITGADPSATGALYIFYEVIYSFAGHVDAIMLLAFAVLLVLPFRYVYFGRRDAWRPSLVVPAVLFALAMVFGRSFDEMQNALLVTGGISRLIESAIAGVGWMLMAHVGFYHLFEFFDWLARIPLGFSETRYGRLFDMLDALLNRHPLVIPALVLAVAWAPMLIGSLPGLFMGDTGTQIREVFNYRYDYEPGDISNTSDYLVPEGWPTMLNGHHPVVHTLLMGGAVKLGIALFGSENIGIGMCTVGQYAITVLVTAYLLSTMRRFGIGLGIRGFALGFFALMPMFSNYAVLLTKDTLFADALVVLVAQMAKMLAGRTAGQMAERAAAEPAAAAGVSGAAAESIGVSGSFPPIPFGARDTVLFVAAALGCTFLRNGGIVFPAAVCVLAFILCPRVRRQVAAALVVAVVAWMAFSRLVMPALDIIPGSRREMLSIPFQQVARYVLEHDGANAGSYPGAADGSLSSEERAAIDRVLGYADLASRYDPAKSDAVKNGFNEDCTPEDLAAFFSVWARLALRDPACYVNALASNYYGYFYPSRLDAWVYSPAFSREVMMRPDTASYFDFEQPDSAVVDFFSHAVTLYRALVQRTPLLSMFMSTPTYTWLLALICVYLLRGRSWRALALHIPLLLVLAMCLVGPCNGSTYMRYIYPIIVLLPFTVPVAACWPRRLSS